MSKTITVKIEGLKEIADAFEHLPDATSAHIVQRILDERARPIADAARALCPADTGELRDSIIVSAELSPRQSALHETEEADIEVFIGSSLFYAHMQEFGTEHNPPHPFMRPAWDGAKNALLTNLKEDLWDEIETAVGKAARRGKG
jgi:HK97 gp10 family phage protein